MAENAAGNDRARSGFWRWQGPDDAMLLIVVACTILVSHFYGKSELANASFLAVVLCGGLAWEAFRGRYLDKWTRSMAWRLRIGAVVIGVWLFLAAHSLAIGITVVAAYVVLYLLCERVAWRRARAEQTANRNLAS